jgi:hypothetical protein
LHIVEAEEYWANYVTKVDGRFLFRLLAYIVFELLLLLIEMRIFGWNVLKVVAEQLESHLFNRLVFSTLVIFGLGRKIVNEVDFFESKDLAHDIVVKFSFFCWLDNFSKQLVVCFSLKSFCIELEDLLDNGS